MNWMLRKNRKKSQLQNSSTLFLSYMSKYEMKSMYVRWNGNTDKTTNKFSAQLT